MTRQLTARSRLETLRKEAKRWLKALRAQDAKAHERLRRAYPSASAQPGLRDVQHALALEHGIANWTALKTHVAEIALANSSREDLVGEFLEHASLHYGVRPGTTEWDRLYYDHPSRWEYAARILRRHPDIASAGIHAAAVCGNLAEVERILAARPDAATEKGGREGWLPIDYVCFGRLPTPEAAANGVAIARALLDANPIRETGIGYDRHSFHLLIGAIGAGESEQPPHPQAVALAELLVERGADPYNPQVLYNTSLGNDNLFWLDFLYDRCAQRNETHKWTASSPQWPKSSMLDYLLTNAVSQNSLQRARWVLTRGANPRSPHYYSKRNLHTEALLKGHTEMAALLLKSGGITETLEGHDAFQVACLRLDRDAAASLVAKHPEYLRSPAPLMWAASHDLRDVAELLLDLGMSPDVANHTNHRPLHAAAGSDSVAVGTLLIDRGAEIDPVETQFYGIPLTWAMHGKRERMIAILSRLSRKPWALARLGNIERLRELFDEAPTLARTADEGGSLLFCLPDDEERALEVAELLLAYGADPRVTDKDGTTAAEHAEKRGLDPVADLLREASAAGAK